MKRRIVFLVCLTLLVTLTACGNSDTVEDAVPPVEAAGQEPASAPAPIPEPTPAPMPEPEQKPEQSGGKVLVAYFSATSNTRRVAESIADTLDADLFELVPVEAYTSDDLNYNNASSRVSREHEDESLQTVELAASTVDKWDEYDTVFIGYPIWWHAAAWPVNGFVTGNDFTGKTVVPFCTSASSGLEDSGTKLRDMAGTGTWLGGQRFSSRASQSDVESWLNSLDLPNVSEAQEAVD